MLDGEASPAPPQRLRRRNRLGANDAIAGALLEAARDRGAEIGGIALLTAGITGKRQYRPVVRQQRSRCRRRLWGRSGHATKGLMDSLWIRPNCRHNGGAAANRTVAVARERIQLPPSSAWDAAMGGMPHGWDGGRKRSATNGTKNVRPLVAPPSQQHTHERNDEAGGHTQCK